MSEKNRSRSKPPSMKKPPLRPTLSVSDAGLERLAPSPFQSPEQVRRLLLLGLLPRPGPRADRGSSPPRFAEDPTEDEAETQVLLENLPAKAVVPFQITAHNGAGESARSAAANVSLG